MMLGRTLTATMLENQLTFLAERKRRKSLVTLKSRTCHNPNVIAKCTDGGNMNYVDGFIVPVPKKNLAAYRRMSQKAGKIWREHGALHYRECLADDVKPGKLTSFPQSVRLRPDETVVFAWITYKSRAHRDRVNAKVMADPRLSPMMDPKAMPFDGKRMFWGGFKVMVDL
jgi:uncharacterized protein YbaA (DUF1428 family)